MKFLKKILFVIGTAVLLLYCSPKIYIPSVQQIMKAQQYWADVDSTFLSEGNVLYEKKCGSCHFLYRPGKYSAKEWENVLPGMKDKAKLTDEEYNYIKIYLYSLSAEK